jgi:hypothetical protein
VVRHERTSTVPRDAPVLWTGSGRLLLTDAVQI